jgi:hypothetical protein
VLLFSPFLILILALDLRLVLRVFPGRWIWFHRFPIRWAPSPILGLASAREDISFRLSFSCLARRQASLLFPVFISRLGTRADRDQDFASRAGPFPTQVHARAPGLSRAAAFLLACPVSVFTPVWISFPASVRPVPSLISLPACSVRFQFSFPGERAICLLFRPVSAAGAHLVLAVPGAVAEARPSVSSGQVWSHVQKSSSLP